MKFSSILKPSTNICENIKNMFKFKKQNTKMGKFSLLVVLLLNF